jgi:hypothetical protein
MPASPPLLAFALLLGLALGTPAAAAVPELRFEAPADLAGEARRLASLPPTGSAAAARLVGLGGTTRPIRVALVPERSPGAGVPPWISGYALPERDLVVLLPQRITSYPNDSLAEVLRHEVAHVLLARAAGGGELPRWFHEGVATLAAGEWGLQDRSTLAFAVMRRPPESVAELDGWFAQGSGEAAHAYAISTAFVRELERRQPGFVAATARGVAGGLAFERAARRAGVDLDRAAAGFLRRQTLLWRWLPLLTSSTLLWIGVTALALVAIRSRRRRDRRLRELWETEDALAAVRAASLADEDESVN